MFAGPNPAYPVLTFDDDGYPYVLRAPEDLLGHFESPHYAAEFQAAFDSAGTPLCLEWTAAGVPRLVPVRGDAGALLSLVRRATTIRGALMLDLAGFERLSAGEVVRRVCQALPG
ncbi:hypothetical protein ACOBQX_11040 [Actinokineospora sp. G85]|uniref:hypothetical protein n=1 Tax=Actinokineospora sp. G85 TaxID=3406626 RepID=UPI003C792CA1